MFKWLSRLEQESSDLLLSSGRVVRSIVSESAASTLAFFSTPDPLEERFKNKSKELFVTCLRDRNTFLYELARRETLRNKEGKYNYKDKTQDVIIQELSESRHLNNITSTTPNEDSTDYYVSDRRIFDELSEAGIDIREMGQLDILRYSCAVHYSVAESGYLQYFEDILKELKERISLLDEQKKQMISQYHLERLPDDRLLKDNIIYISLTEEPGTTHFKCTVKNSEESPIECSIDVNALEPHIVTPMTIEKLTDYIPQILNIIELFSSINEQISIEEHLVGERETTISPQIKKIESILRAQIKELLPIKIAEDIISQALDKQEIEATRRAEARDILFQCALFWGNQSSFTTTELMTKLTEFKQEIEAYQSEKKSLQVVETQILTEAAISPTSAVESLPIGLDDGLQRSTNPFDDDFIDEPSEPLHTEEDTLREEPPTLFNPIEEPLIEEPASLVADIQEPPRIAAQTQSNLSTGLYAAAFLMGGTVLIAASVALVILSQGCAAPISLAGILIGTKMIAASAAALGTIGLFGLAASYGIISYEDNDQPAEQVNNI